MPRFAHKIFKQAAAVKVASKHRSRSLQNFSQTSRRNKITKKINYVQNTKKSKNIFYRKQKKC